MGGGEVSATLRIWISLFSVGLCVIVILSLIYYILHDYPWYSNLITLFLLKRIENSALVVFFIQLLPRKRRTAWSIRSIGRVHL